MNKCLFSLLMLLLFSFSCSHTVIKPTTTNTDQAIEKTASLMKNIIPIKLNEQVKINDSLSIKLIDFSHKRPLIGGPTKATAYITLMYNGENFERSLSQHGIQGKPEIIEYDSFYWEKNLIQLNKFSYNNSIEIIITPNHE